MGTTVANCSCRGGILSETLLRLYHQLPSPARSVVASLRGYHLRWWRYGPETERLVEEALEREQWDSEKWRSWQEERLAYVLHRAATQVPYYREQWTKRRSQGDRASWEYLENWPLLDKEPLRENPTAFVADDCEIRQMFHEHSSGTTGKSLDFWLDRKTVQAWYALAEARWRRWYGVSRHDRWAILGGQLITPVNQKLPPFWVWNGGLNQLYMSSYHLAPDLISHYLDALQSYRITYLYGYTSSLYALAQEALRLGRDDLQMKVVVTNAEPVFNYQRQAIAEAFQCSVRESYGISEYVAAASECEEQSLHLWPEVGWVELFKNDRAIQKGTSGDLVCTGLLNVDMPLVRYWVGDHVTLSPKHIACTCNRNLPVLDSVEGRVDDLLYTPEGRLVGRLDPVFKARLPVREAQIIQEALDRILVRYVPAPEFTPEAGQSIIERLQARMGSVEVILEQMEEIPRGPNGKFRAVICKLSPEQKAEI